MGQLDKLASPWSQSNHGTAAPAISPQLLFFVAQSQELSLVNLPTLGCIPALCRRLGPHVHLSGKCHTAIGLSQCSFNRNELHYHL